ncbi:hypothetical protein PG990_000861 [Apiospora arundinis]|uniref:Maltose permease n=1 Tax=Apiospora arundinis TaxID=335852 RepID=A0ABR2I0K1_9PEZI
MKFNCLASIALLAAVGAEARNCKAGLNYCGSTLLSIGDYRGQIQQAMVAAGHDPNTYPNEYLFSCVGGSEGLISVLNNCDRGCQDNGKDKSDTCK